MSGFFRPGKLVMGTHVILSAVYVEAGFKKYFVYISEQ
jgi:hypothetical protein